MTLNIQSLPNLPFVSGAYGSNTVVLLPQLRCNSVPSLVHRFTKLGRLTANDRLDWRLVILIMIQIFREDLSIVLGALVSLYEVPQPRQGDDETRLLLELGELRLPQYLELLSCEAESAVDLVSKSGVAEVEQLFFVVWY